METRSLKYEVKSQIGKIIWITFFWTLFSVFQFSIGYITLVDLKVDLSGLNVVDFLNGTILIGITAGLLGGSLIVFFWGRWLRTKPYGWSLLNMFWSFTVLFFLEILFLNWFRLKFR